MESNDEDLHNYEMNCPIPTSLANEPKEDDNNGVYVSLLSELKYTFEQGISWKKDLDNKAFEMIVLTLINIFLITILMFIRINVIYMGIIIFFTIMSLFYILRSYSIKKYYFPVGHEAFFKNGKYDGSIVNTFLSYTKKEFNENLIQEYLECMKTNSNNNESKATDIKWGHCFYFISIALITIYFYIKI